MNIKSTGKKEIITSPKFQDKEERRLIILDSLDGLLKFHELERNEKNNAVKFYSAFIAGGIALVVSLSNLKPLIEYSFLKLFSITVIIVINYLMIKKLLAVRIASNNIYQEYGRRLQYLIKTHASDLNKDEFVECENVFKKYYGIIKNEKKLLPDYSADKYEINGLWLINVIFSFSYIVPLFEINKNEQYEINSYLLILLFLVLISGTASFGYYMINNAKSAPGYENV